MGLRHGTGRAETKRIDLLNRASRVQLVPKKRWVKVAMRDEADLDERINHDIDRLTTITYHTKTIFAYRSQS